jgi:hypothetical protein
VVNGVQGEMENKWKAEIDLQPTRYPLVSSFHFRTFALYDMHSSLPGKKIYLGKIFAFSSVICSKRAAQRDKKRRSGKREGRKSKRGVRVAPTRIISDGY